MQSCQELHINARVMRLGGQGCSTFDIQRVRPAKNLQMRKSFEGLVVAKKLDKKHMKSWLKLQGPAWGVNPAGRAAKPPFPLVHNKVWIL
jgi:hypothetical protein